MPTNQYGKKLYDDTATVIMDLFMTGRIDTEELHCLLNLLEAVMIKREQQELIALLKKWRPGIEHTEIDDIIKATLLALNYDDKDDMDHSLALLDELINLGE
ncbi:MAG: hypothetical protein ACOX0F_10615 [Syntrophomonadaceae bacterium]|jgi:hypothetical protein